MDGFPVEKLWSEEVDELGEGRGERGGEVLEFEFFDDGLPQVDATGGWVVAESAGKLAGARGASSRDLSECGNPGELGESGGGGHSGGEADADFVDVRGHGENGVGKTDLADSGHLPLEGEEGEKLGEDLIGPDEILTLQGSADGGAAGWGE